MKLLRINIEMRCTDAEWARVRALAESCRAMVSDLAGGEPSAEIRADDAKTMRRLGAAFLQAADAMEPLPAATVIATEAPKRTRKAAAR